MALLVAAHVLSFISSWNLYELDASIHVTLSRTWVLSENFAIFHLISSHRLSEEQQYRNCEGIVTMVKSYQRFEQSASFGVISSNSNCVYIPPANRKGLGQVLTGGLEKVTFGI